MPTVVVADALGTTRTIVRIDALAPYQRQLASLLEAGRCPQCCSRLSVEHVADFALPRPPELMGVCRNHPGRVDAWSVDDTWVTYVSIPQEGRCPEQETRTTS